MGFEARLPRDAQPATALEVAGDHARPPIAAGHLGLDVVGASLWRGTEFGSVVTHTVSTGWDSFDAQLPGGGWPCGAIAEVLGPQPGVLEWRICGPALRRVVAQDGQVVVVGPPRYPHLPGLMHEGLDERHLVWIQAEPPAERLWVTEQLIKANAAGVVMAWLPQARQEQIRRLQINAQSCDGLVFLFRPEQAQHEASAAPLRIHATHSLDWELHVHIFKRRGPVHDGVLVLPSVPGGLQAVLTPRIKRPSQMRMAHENLHVVGSPATRHRNIRQPIAAH